MRKTGLFPQLLLSASVEGLILPKVLERVVRMGELDILFRFIQEKNIEMIASLGTKKATSDEHSCRIYKGAKITKKIIWRGRGWLEKRFLTMKYISVEEVKTKICLQF